MLNWEFLQDASDSWYWSCTDRNGIRKTSTKTFESGRACVEDAMMHGYTLSLAQEQSAEKQSPRNDVA